MEFYNAMIIKIFVILHDSIASHIPHKKFAGKWKGKNYHCRVRDEGKSQSFASGVGKRLRKRIRREIGFRIKEFVNYKKGFKID